MKADDLSRKLQPEQIIIAALGIDQDRVEPTWIAVGGSDEAKAKAIAEASRRWRAQHPEKSGGS